MKSENAPKDAKKEIFELNIHFPNICWGKCSFDAQIPIFIGQHAIFLMRLQHIRYIHEDNFDSSILEQNENDLKVIEIVK